MPEKQHRPQGQRLGGGVGAGYRRANLPCQTPNDRHFRFFDRCLGPSCRASRALMWGPQSGLQELDENLSKPTWNLRIFSTAFIVHGFAAGPGGVPEPAMSV